MTGVMAGRGRASRAPQRGPDEPVPAAAAEEPQNEDQAPIVGEHGPELVDLPPGSEVMREGDDSEGQAEAEPGGDDAADDQAGDASDDEDDATDEGEPAEEAPEQTTDYTRCGGHVLTDHGWIPEDQLEQLGATRTRIEE